MEPQTLDKRVEILERKMESLVGLPDRVGALELQISQFRADVHGEFSAVRAEVRSLEEGLRQEMRTLNDETRHEMRELNDETCTQMRVLHEEVLARFALLDEHATGRTRSPGTPDPKRRRKPRSSET